MRHFLGMSCAIALLTIGASVAMQAQSENVSLDSLQFLVGKWNGEGSAEAAQKGSGYCSFEPALQGKVLIRKNHAEYPASNGHAAIVHDDVMIIYPDDARKQLRAFYTDNEGNVINYIASASKDGKTVVLLSEADNARPRYRLTYVLTQPDRVTVTFEMARAAKPDEFQKFLGGNLRKIANAE